MAYKLAEEDKLCGVIYPTYEGFSPIPKATCDMLESKCEQTIIVKCGESSDEGKKPESQSGSASASTSESTSVSESTSTESTSTESTSQSESVSTSESTSVSQSTSESTSNSVSNSESKSESSSVSESTSESTSSVSTSESTSTSTESTSTSESNSVSESTSTSASSSESTSVSESTSESTTTSTSTSVSTSESASSSTENSNTPEEPKPNPEPQPEPVPTIDLLEVLPKVEDKFSTLIVKDGQVVEVPEVSEEDKRAFEDKIINDLKAKLPEGTTVEAVLEGANYEKGSEVIVGKTNYNLKVRTTLNGKVSEHTYSVPHTEEAPKEVPEVSDEEIKGIINNINFNYGSVEWDTEGHVSHIYGAYYKPVTPELLGIKAKVFEETVKGKLEGKVSDVNLELIQKVKIGDSVPLDYATNGHAFKAILTITKLDGTKLVIEKGVVSGAIDSL